MRSIEIPQPADRDFKYRLFEILPGALTWIILSLPITLSIISAKLATYFVIAYLLLWFARAIGIDIRALQGWRNMNTHKNLPWKKLNQDLENLIAKTLNAPRWHARNLRRVEKNIPTPGSNPARFTTPSSSPFGMNPAMSWNPPSNLF